MVKNLRGIERALRIILGLSVVIAALYFDALYAAPIGLLLLASGGYGFCPLYALLRKKPAKSCGCGCE